MLQPSRASWDGESRMGALGLHAELQPCMSAGILSYTLCTPSPTQAAGWGHAATSVPRWLGKLFPQCLLFNWPGFTESTPRFPSISGEIRPCTSMLCLPGSAGTATRDRFHTQSVSQCKNSAGSATSPALIRRKSRSFEMRFHSHKGNKKLSTL